MITLRIKFRALGITFFSIDRTWLIPDKPTTLMSEKGVRLEFRP